VAVGISNPISLGDVAVQESISLYDGNTATGNSIAEHQGNEQLHGGNQLFTYVYLSSPFNIPALSYATLKIKLVPLLSNIPSAGFQLYRGVRSIGRKLGWEVMNCLGI